MTEQKLIVAAVKPNHPSGRRNRAGFVFSTEYQVFSVNAEQERLINEDPYIRVIDKGTAFKEAMERYEKNPTSKPSETNEADGIDGNQGKTAAEIEEEEKKKKEADEEARKKKEAEDEEERKKKEADAKKGSEPKPISRMNKEELIAGLIAKGQISGKDFNPESSNKALVALLVSLS